MAVGFHTNIDVVSYCFSAICLALVDIAMTATDTRLILALIATMICAAIFGGIAVKGVANLAYENAQGAKP